MARRTLREFMDNLFEGVADLQLRYVDTGMLSPEEFTRLQELDPTNTKKYLGWMCRVYAREHRIENMDIVKTFHDMVSRKVITGADSDLGKYRNTEQVQDLISRKKLEQEEKELKDFWNFEYRFWLKDAPIEARRALKQAWEKAGLELGAVSKKHQEILMDVASKFNLANPNDLYKQKEEEIKKYRASGDMVEVFHNTKCAIYYVGSKEAAIALGKGSWCIAVDEANPEAHSGVGVTNRFEQYFREHNFYIIIDKAAQSDPAKWRRAAMQCSQGEDCRKTLWDAQDKPTLIYQEDPSKPYWNQATIPSEVAGVIKAWELPDMFNEPGRAYEKKIGKKVDMWSPEDWKAYSTWFKAR